MSVPDWWKNQRKISVVVDNNSWILPYAENIVRQVCDNGDLAVLCRDYESIDNGTVAFYLGCLKITPPEILARNRRNLVVHASDLPKGRGMSPWTWQVLEGAQSLPMCLLEAEKTVDSGAVIYKDWIDLQGTELVDDLRALIGFQTQDLCLRFLAESAPPEGEEQVGEPTYYARRSAADSEIDPEKAISDQFDLLRVVDNEHYPAWFSYRGSCYKLKIEKAD